MDWVLQRAVQIGDLATTEFVRVGWSRGCASGARAISCASCSCRCSSAISMSLRRRAGTPFGDRIDDAPDTLFDRVSHALQLLGLGTLVSARPVDLGHELVSEDLSRFARMPVVGSWVQDKKGMWFLIASLVDLSVGLAFGSLAPKKETAMAPSIGYAKTRMRSSVAASRTARPLPPDAVTHLSTGGYLLNGEWLPEIASIRRGESYTRVLERAPAQHPTAWQRPKRQRRRLNLLRLAMG
jgi:hypothetical protein